MVELCGADSSPKCVFIGGCGRSGTTMLGSALGAADRAIVTQESQFKLRLLKKIFEAKTPLSAPEMYEAIANDRKFIALWQMKPEVRSQDAATDMMGTARRVIFDVVDQYAAALQRSNWAYWIDHTPENIRYISELLAFSPDAKFIHLIRDGRAVAASVLPLDWGPNDAQHAGRWWIREIAFGLAAEKRYPDRVLQVRYEDLVTAPERTLRTICGFLGIDFVPAMVSANALSAPGYTRRQHQLVGSTITSSQVSTWRSKLTEQQIAVFEAEAGEMLGMLGYKCVITDRSKCPGPTQLVLIKIWALIQRQLNQRRQRAREDRAIGNFAGPMRG